MGYKEDRVSFELVCGQLKPDASPEDEARFEETSQNHAMAKKIAYRMGFESYFEEHIEDKTIFLDGYVYAPLDRAVEALKALKDAGVEVDIADVYAKGGRKETIRKSLEKLDWLREIN